MSETYRDYQQELVPGWLQGAVGGNWEFTFGLVKDALVEAARQATKARFVTEAPADALGLLRGDRNLDAHPGESDLRLRARIEHAWITWEAAGTGAAILQALRDVGYGGAELREGTQWNLPHWWWFYVVLKAPFPWASGSPTDADRETLCALINKWKPAHAYHVQSIVLESGLLWGDRPIWGKCPPWGGTKAIYWTC